MKRGDTFQFRQILGGEILKGYVLAVGNDHIAYKYWSRTKKGWQWRVESDVWIAHLKSMATGGG